MNPAAGASYLLLLLFAAALTGCTTTHAVEGDEAPERTGLVWLTHALEEEGIFVSERGLAPLRNTPADNTRRLLLNGQVVVDVYRFANATVAEAEARQFAGLFPRNDVFWKDDLVVIRSNDRDAGLSYTLRLLLGDTI